MMLAELGNLPFLCLKMRCYGSIFASFLKFTIKKKLLP